MRWPSALCLFTLPRCAVLYPPCVCVFELLLPAAVCFELLRPGALRGAQRAVVCVV